MSLSPSTIFFWWVAIFISGQGLLIYFSQWLTSLILWTKLHFVPAFPGKAATFPSADTFLSGRDPHFCLVTQLFVPCIFCGVLINCADNRDACPWRTLTLNKCFCLTFIAICSFKRIRTETKKVSYVLCASHDISKIDPSSIWRHSKGEIMGRGRFSPFFALARREIVSERLELLD